MTEIMFKREETSVETLLKNKEIFFKLNQYRLDRAFEFMPRRTAIVFRALPFLLHINHPHFPGYVENLAVPCGIKFYDITQETINALYVLFPRAKKDIDNIKSFLPRHNFIRSLLLMGSIGSIAQNNKSDFDFWVCIHEEHFKPAWMDRFIKKLRLIEEWSETKHGVEIHFFPTDIKKARANIFGESDNESAGSSQAKILKEEFYRTMILLTGKIPVWWIMPPGVDDKEYKKLIEMIHYYPELGRENFIDLGNLHEISYKEFFGSALWQINKAMDSPFKSVLKMGLLESHASNMDNPMLLCEEIKKDAFESKGENLFIDPYVVMFDHVLKYYQGTENESVVDLLCKCFYIKIGVKASFDKLKNKKVGLKEKEILTYARKWNWDHHRLKNLNSFKEWNFKKVLQLGDEVHSFMIKAYQRLTDQLKEKSLAGHVITETDLTILGRKLFTFYSKKPYKVMRLRKAFDYGYLQDDVTFHASQDMSLKTVWTLYRSPVTKTTIKKEDMTDRLLIKYYDIIYIIAWMVFNRIIDSKTRMHLTPNFTNVQFSDIQRLIKKLFAFYPDFSTTTLTNEDLLLEARKKQFFIVFNFESDRTKWDVETVSVLFLTTWGELYYEHYVDPKMGIKKISQYIKNLDLGDMTKLQEQIHIYVPKGPQYRSLLKNIDQLIQSNTGVTLNL